jgi:hypothetical protein
MLVNKPEDIERQFGCTIMPAMISSVFWNHFVPSVNRFEGFARLV